MGKKPQMMKRIWLFFIYFVFGLVIDKRYVRLFIDEISDVKGWLSLHEGYLLYLASLRVSAGDNIVEIGSYEGRSTLALAKYSHPNSFFAIDPHSGDISEVSQGLVVSTLLSFSANIKKSGLGDRVVPVIAKSENALDLHDYSPVGLLFIDGWHSESAVLRDIDNFLPLCRTGATIIFDDWSDPVILSAINQRRHLLPRYSTSVGKDLLFSDDVYFQSVRIKIKLFLVRTFAKSQKNPAEIGLNSHPGEE
jgi:predicted O-methyltransferase YrrM